MNLQTQYSCKSPPHFLCGEVKENLFGLAETWLLGAETDKSVAFLLALAIGLSDMSGLEHPVQRTGSLMFYSERLSR